MLQEIVVSSLAVLILIPGVWSHGFMWFPWTWNNENQIPLGKGLEGAKFGWYYPQPDVVCDPKSGAQCSGSSIKGYTTDWFSNFTFVPSSAAFETTMPSEMYDHIYNGPLIKSMTWEVNGENRLNPWTQPGTAPVFGEGCGSNGGNPTGCAGDEIDTNPYGTCCTKAKGGIGCGGYVGGKSALDHYADGLFDAAGTTTWTIGKTYPVVWETGAGHRGGYAYRLCKVPSGGVTKITEKCFQDGHLDFVGKFNWVYNGMIKDSLNGSYDPSKWHKMKAVRSNQGTYPLGSMWTKLEVPVDKTNGWSIKDRVIVPDNLTPGDYILSFRWDSQRTPQIWSNCANIKLVK